MEGKQGGLKISKIGLPNLSTATFFDFKYFFPRLSKGIYYHKISWEKGYKVSTWHFSKMKINRKNTEEFRNIIKWWTFFYNNSKKGVMDSNFCSSLRSKLHKNKVLANKKQAREEKIRVQKHSKVAQSVLTKHSFEHNR